ncbi:MAG: hypothetical protein JXA81_11295 [Sedimentisphaerales bacterium]|nr:hypothetical protein [Sedimentisphaerales bacterium]
MSSKKTTFGLRLGQLADLFAMAVKNQELPEAECTEENLPQMLRDELAEVMPGSSLLFPTVSEISTSRQSDVALLVGQSLQQLFFGPEATIGQLQLIKEASKRLTGTLASGAQRAVANTLYHATIARCLTLYNKKITKHSYEKLDESFTLLMEKDWMAAELVELFSNARRICQTMWSN